jgi:hypothetical protein
MAIRAVLYEITPLLLKLASCGVNWDGYLETIVSIAFFWALQSYLYFEIYQKNRKICQGL